MSKQLLPEKTPSQSARKCCSLVIAILICIHSPGSYAAEFFLGFSVQGTNLYAEDHVSLYDFAEMRSDRVLVPVWAIKTTDNYFSNSSFGYFIEFGEGFYSVNKQVIASQELDIGTSLSGEYWFITPTIFYNFTSKNPDKWSLKVGAGIGMGYLTVSGDIKMTDKPGQPIEFIQGNGYDVSIGLFVEYEYKRWIIQLKEYSPRANLNGTDFSIETPSVIIGYKFDI